MQKQTRAKKAPSRRVRVLTCSADEEKIVGKNVS
ncbi:hypothetical protein [Klebsiella variicola]|nr:hypothetical protein [Klebsiella variicola]MDM7171812.1 hypothetical protein [Klebsiella variicola]